jgi:hypothetical protein
MMNKFSSWQTASEASSFEMAKRVNKYRSLEKNPLEAAPDVASEPGG